MSKIIKNTFLLDKIKEAIRSFSNRKNVTGYPYFAEKLGFSERRGQDILSKLFSDKTEKYLKVDELIIILDNLEEDRKIILQSLLQRYDYSLVDKYRNLSNLTDFKDVLLKITAKNGDLINSFYDAISDNKLTPKEKKELQEKIKETYSFLGILDKALK